MNKFVYEKGELDIARTQCEFCVYNNPETPESCEQYKIKPDEIIRNRKKCPLLKDNVKTPW